MIWSPETPSVRINSPATSRATDSEAAEMPAPRRDYPVSCVFRFIHDIREAVSQVTVIGATALGQ
jgi:hypothetical protein